MCEERSSRAAIETNPVVQELEIGFRGLERRLRDVVRIDLEPGDLSIRRTVGRPEAIRLRQTRLIGRDILVVDVVVDARPLPFAAGHVEAAVAVVHHREEIVEMLVRLLAAEQRLLATRLAHRLQLGRPLLAHDRGLPVAFARRMPVFARPAGRHLAAMLLIGLDDVAAALDELRADVVPEVPRPRTAGAQARVLALSQPRGLDGPDAARAGDAGMPKGLLVEPVRRVVPIGAILLKETLQRPEVSARIRIGVRVVRMEERRHLPKLLVRRIQREIVGRDPILAFLPAEHHGHERRAGELDLPVAIEKRPERLGAVKPVPIEERHDRCILRPGGDIGTVEKLRTTPSLSFGPRPIVVRRVIPVARAVGPAVEAGCHHIIGETRLFGVEAPLHPIPGEVALRGTIDAEPLRAPFRVLAGRIEERVGVIVAAELAGQRTRLVTDRMDLACAVARIPGIADDSALVASRDERVVTTHGADVVDEREAGEVVLGDRAARLRFKLDVPAQTPIPGRCRDGVGGGLEQPLLEVGIGEAPPVGYGLAPHGLRVTRRGLVHLGDILGIGQGHRKGDAVAVRRRELDPGPGRNRADIAARVERHAHRRRFEDFRIDHQGRRQTG